MEKDIFDNKSNPFTVPDGYFETLQERIMCRIENDAECQLPKSRIITMTPLRKLLAVAACLLFIFTGAALFITYSDKQPAVAEVYIDDELYQWLYSSDIATLLAESLDITMPENFMGNEADYSEEEEAIIRFFERDNVNLIAMLNYIDDDTFFIP